MVRLNSGFKSPGIHPGYYFCDFPSKNDNLGLKMTVLKFLGIQPGYGQRDPYPNDTSSLGDLVESFV